MIALRSGNARNEKITLPDANTRCLCGALLGGVSPIRISGPVERIAILDKPRIDRLAVCPLTRRHGTLIAIKAGQRTSRRARSGEEGVESVGSDLSAPIGFAILILAALPAFRGVDAVETDTLPGDLYRVPIDDRSPTFYRGFGDCRGGERQAGQKCNEKLHATILK